MPFPKPFPICFDIDDTLVAGTGYKFRRVMLECCIQILDALAPEPVSPTRLLQMQHENDLRLMPKYGFTRPRFSRSIVEAYQTVVRERGKEPDPVVERRLYRTAGSAFRPPYTSSDFAHVVLAVLRSWGHPLYSVTIGPKAAQQRKLQLTGLGRFFDDVAFATTIEEKQAAIAGFLCNGSRSPGVMVGDSLHHDISTALAVGAHAVWVRTPDLWTVFDAKLDPASYHTIDKLDELPPLIEQLSRSYPS